MEWVHKAPSFSHPGNQQSTQLLRNAFWWPSLAANSKRSVETCSVFARVHTFHQLPAGLLKSLPVPRHPWAHIAMDFVMDLPSSYGFTTILLAVDRFSKACKPTDMETATTLFSHLFRNYGIPESGTPPEIGMQPAHPG